MRAEDIDDDALAAAIEQVAAETRFSGAVRVERAGHPRFERAFGLADRRWSVPFELATRASIASGTKGFTALTVMALVERDVLDLETTARSLLGTDLPQIDDSVTVAHLLAHRSGIGDYLDESLTGDINDYLMPVPVQRLDSTESYLAVLDGHAQVTSPGDQFAYNNGGYVVLALLAERAAGTPFEQLVVDLVCRPAGLTATSFIQSDSLPAGVATGYLEPDGLRTNALHLPLLGSGDGGLFSTVADVSRLWQALFHGRIVTTEAAKTMTAPHSDAPEERQRYGLGFWLHATGPTVMLEGYDAGVSFRSLHDPTTGTTQTVIGNTSNGAWPVLRAMRGLLGPD